MIFAWSNFEADQVPESLDRIRLAGTFEMRYDNLFGT